MKIYGLICPVCKKDAVPQPEYAEDEFYVCSDCGTPLGYYCKGCDEFYDRNRLILHDDLYVCKACGTPQYGYSTWKNKKGRDRN